MRARRGAIAALLVAGLGLAVVVTGCRQVLGIGGVGFGGSGGSGGAGSGGGGASSASSSSSGGGATSSSSGGPQCSILHAGGGTCEYLPGHECGCTAPKKCSVVNEVTGASACVFAGSTAPFDKCATDADCEAGTFCDAATTACDPICADDMDCLNDGGGTCRQAMQADGVNPIPDLRLCVAHCDPVSVAPCGEGLTCVYEDVLKDFDCVHSGGVPAGSNCSADGDCQPTYACINVGTGKQCLAWCTPPGFSTSCSPAGQCVAFNPPVEKDSTEYGVCD
jgi:hypothetical protein